MSPELTDEQTESLVRLSPRIIERYPCLRVRIFSQRAYYPRHPIAVPGARLLVSDELIVSAVLVERPEVHGLEYSFDLAYLTLEETRFLAGIALAVHPDNGRAWTYPLLEHVDVDFRADDDAVIKAAQQLATRIFDHPEWSMGRMPPPACGGTAYQWREDGVNVDNVHNGVCATELNDQLLMRGLGSLLRADMCCQHPEITDAAHLQFYIALDASFQMILRLLREQGVSNPTALDAGALIDEVFYPEIETGAYFSQITTRIGSKPCTHRAGLECSRCHRLITAAIFCCIPHWLRSTIGASPSRSSSQATPLNRSGEGVRDRSSHAGSTTWPHGPH
jgi:hypothetical protein